METAEKEIIPYEITWKEIPGYPDHEINLEGQVRREKGWPLTVSPTGKVNIRINGKYKPLRVRELYFKTFGVELPAKEKVIKQMPKGIPLKEEPTKESDDDLKHDVKQIWFANKISANIEEVNMAVFRAEMRQYRAGITFIDALYNTSPHSIDAAQINFPGWYASLRNFSTVCGEARTRHGMTAGELEILLPRMRQLMLNRYRYEHCFKIAYKEHYRREI